MEVDRKKPTQAKSVVEDQPFEKVIDNSRQGGSKPSWFSLPPTQNPVGVVHITIVNLLEYVSGQ